MSRHRVVRLTRAERIALIEEAATEEFRTLGFDRASMSGIARRAGIVEGSIYRFFTSKADLLTKVIEHWYQGMLADYARQLSQIEGTRARLRFMIWRHLKTVHDSPEMCRLMFDHVRSSRDYRDTTVYKLNSLYTEQTMQIVREGTARGELRGDLNMHSVRDLIYGGVEHRIWAHLRNEGGFDPDETAEAILVLVLGGIGREDPLPRRLVAIDRKLERLAEAREPEGRTPR